MRAQVTLFIMLGIMILVLGTVFFMYKEILFSRTPELDQETRGLVTGYVVGCLDAASDKSIREFGLSGGGPSAWTEPISGYHVSYGEKFGFNLIPDPEQASAYLSGEIRELFFSCINYTALEGINITAGKDRVIVTLTEEKVAIELDYPMRISKDGMESALKTFTTDYDRRIRNVLLYAKDFVEHSRMQEGPLDPATLDYSCGNVMVCHNDGIVSVYLYRTIYEPPEYKYRFATDADILRGCTQMRPQGCI